MEKEGGRASWWDAGRGQMAILEAGRGYSFISQRPASQQPGSTFLLSKDDSWLLDLHSHANSESRISTDGGVGTLFSFHIRKYSNSFTGAITLDVWTSILFSTFSNTGFWISISFSAFSNSAVEVERQRIKENWIILNYMSTILLLWYFRLK